MISTSLCYPTLETQDTAEHGSRPFRESVLPKTGNKVTLEFIADDPGDWSEVDISQNNADKNSYSIDILINAYCVSSSASYVYFDTVSVGQ
jgi:hypothetical protein